jgi:hypothetical protein
LCPAHAGRLPDIVDEVVVLITAKVCGNITREEEGSATLLKGNGRRIWDMYQRIFVDIEVEVVFIVVVVVVVVVVIAAAAANNAFVLIRIGMGNPAIIVKPISVVTRTGQEDGQKGSLLLRARLERAQGLGR